MIQNGPDSLLNKKQAANLLNVSEATVSRWIVEGRGPKHVKFGTPGNRGALVRYRMNDLLAYLEANTHGGAEAA
jgi:predicted DNA-binding transcriptional regulator AlpA